ncbi:hypothetical protein EF918_20125 [Streptomyces sp. WAC06614]|nr:hypothetical protein [Streptomyces sp. WAC06614]RSS78647.1 hypothetical protein EF918_20125 [Streptomyces sp. WAC06614]
MDQETFVPEGKTVHLYTEDNYRLYAHDALQILSGDGRQPKLTRKPSEPVQNYRLGPLAELDKVLMISAAGSDRALLLVDGPMRLCTGGCSPATGRHDCEGILGTYTEGHDHVHLLCCRGGELESRAVLPADFKEEAVRFVQLRPEQRIARWRELSASSPRMRDRLLTARPIKAWLDGRHVRDYADSRSRSEFAVARGMEMLDQQSRAALVEYGRGLPELRDLCQEARRQREDADQIVGGLGEGLDVPAWESLSLESREDLLALRHGAVGTVAAHELKRSGNELELWRCSVGTAEWRYARGERVVLFRNKFYAVLGPCTASPVWPECRDQVWCWVEWAGGGKQLVHLGTATTPERGDYDSYRNGEAFASDRELYENVAQFLALDHQGRVEVWESLCEIWQERQDTLLAHEGIKVFRIVRHVEHLAGLRPSDYAIARYVRELDPDSQELFDRFTAAGDASCAALWEDYAVQLTSMGELFLALRRDADTTGWLALSPASLEDLLAAADEDRRDELCSVLASAGVELP